MKKIKWFSYLFVLSLLLSGLFVAVKYDFIEMPGLAKPESTETAEAAKPDVAEIPVDAEVRGNGRTVANVAPAKSSVAVPPLSHLKELLKKND